MALAAAAALLLLVCAWAQDPMNNLVDQWAEKFSDTLFDRALYSSPSHHADVDSIVLGKAGNLAMAPHTKLKPFLLPPHAHATHGQSVLRGVSYPMKFRAKARPAFPKQGIVSFTSLTPLSNYPPQRSALTVRMAKDGKKEIDAEEATQKYGLEVGLFQAMTNKNASKIKPADLLKRYGAAYLSTSIALAIVSYGACYALILKGVDVAALLLKIGISATPASSTAGTAAIAYAVHKAASPLRFPPTVALTPMVARMFKRASTVKPADLLKKYGVAYLATSISLSLVSFGTLYALVSAGIDVAALLTKIGIAATRASSTAGTAAIAYAFHKAASPMRFPVTVALTPVVARWFGKKIDDNATNIEKKQA